MVGTVGTVGVVCKVAIYTVPIQPTPVYIYTYIYIYMNYCNLLIYKCKHIYIYI